jgi:hypothetical protein
MSTLDLVRVHTQTQPGLRADTAISELKHSVDATRDRLTRDTRGEAVPQQSVAEGGPVGADHQEPRED